MVRIKKIAWETFRTEKMLEKRLYLIKCQKKLLESRKMMKFENC